MLYRESYQVPLTIIGTAKETQASKASLARKGIPSALLCFSEAPSATLNPSLVLPEQERHRGIDAGTEEAKRMFRGLEHLSNKKG